MLGMVHLEDVSSDSLKRRIGNSRVVGIDPGIKCPLVSWTFPDDPDDCQQDLVGETFDSINDAQNSIQDPTVTKMTLCHWRKLTGELEFQKKVQHFRQHYNTKEIIDLLSSATTTKDYLVIYLTSFTRIFEFTALPMWRKWRFRWYALKQRAYAGVANKLAVSSKLPLVPRLNDCARKQADAERRTHRHMEACTNKTQNLNTHSKPVFAFESPGFGNVRHNAPVPGKGFCKKLARVGLVVLVPKQNTTIACNRCNNCLKYGNNLSRHVSCNHQKRTMTTTIGKNGALCKAKKKIHCLLENGESTRSCFCTAKNLTYYDGRIGVCHHCQEGCPKYVEQDVNAAKNMGQVLFYYAGTGQQPGWNTAQLPH